MASALRKKFLTISIKKIMKLIQIFRKRLSQDVHSLFMTISGLRNVWEILRGIPFIDWQPNLINNLFDHLDSLKTTIPSALHGRYGDFLGEFIS